MDIVEKIASVVLPQVLGNNPQESEANLLTKFITIFASKIAGNDGEPTVDATADGVSIIQNIFPLAEERGELITKLSEIHGVDEARTQGLLASAAPLALGQLNSLSGGSSITSFLQEHLSILGDRLPSWATSILPAGLLGALGTIGAGVSAAGDKVAGVADAAVDTAGDAVRATGDAIGDVAEGAKNLAAGAAHEVGDFARDTKDAAANLAEDVADTGGGLLKSLLPIIGLILLGLLGLFLWKACQPKEAAPTAPVEDVQPADTQVVASESPAGFNISTGEGDTIYACNGQVGDQSLKDKILTSVKNIFGSSEKCDNSIVVDPVYGTALTGGDNLDAALEAIKAVPNASARFVDGKLEVDAPDATALSALVDKLKGLFTGVDVVAAAPVDADAAVQMGVEGALAALNKLDGSATSAQIARALNLQVINFASGASLIPEENKPVLDKAAEVIKAATGVSSLGITGHTDSTGDAAANNTLSIQRAQAVKDYLVSKGVSADILTTAGVGSSQPVATNATENGRFANRRIAFSADAVLADVVEGVATATGAVVEGAGNAVDAVVDTTGNALDAAVTEAADAADAAATATSNAMEDAASALPEIDINVTN